MKIRLEDAIEICFGIAMIAFGAQQLIAPIFSWIISLPIFVIGIWLFYLGFKAIWKTTEK